MRLKEVKISGNSRQKVTEQGKNYFTGNKIGNGAAIGITYNCNNSILNFNGTTSSSGNIFLDIFTGVRLPAGTYTWTIKVNSGTFERNNGDFAIYLRNSENYINGSYTNSGILGNNLDSENRMKSLTFTIEEDTDIYVKMFANQSNIVFNNLELYVQIEKGSSYTEFEQFTPNSPSSKYLSEVECSGDSGNINVEMCNKNLYKGAQEFITSGGVSDSNVFYMFVEENTDYTISITKSRVNGTTISNDVIYLISDIIFYNNDTKLSEIKNSFVNLPSGSISKSYNFTTPKDCNKIKIYTHNNNGDNNQNTLVTNIQLEKGNNATDYILHQSQTYTIPTQQPMRAIGDIRDTFIKKNNKWYERHYILRKIFDGTEDWYGNINSGWTQNEHVFGTPVSGIEDNGQSTNVGKVLMSSHFICDNTNVLVWQEKDFISYYPAYKNGSIMINQQSISTVTELKTWLQSEYSKGTPVYADCILKVPQDIECTMEQSIILDEIEKMAKTYKGVTHIHSTDNVEPNMEVTYFKDIETMINNAVGGGHKWNQ